MPETWYGQINFVIVKMDDFKIVLGMDVLLEHKVILMPLLKCLVVMRSYQTTIQTNTHKPRAMKMISVLQLRKNIYARFHCRIWRGELKWAHSNKNLMTTIGTPWPNTRKWEKAFIFTWVDRSGD